MVKIPAEMDKLTANEWREIGFSRAEFEDRWKARLERDKGSPAIGSDAPDFDLLVVNAVIVVVEKLIKDGKIVT